MNKTKNIFLFLGVSLLAIPIIGQDCPDNELWNQYNVTASTQMVSDYSAGYVNLSPDIVADDFILSDADRRVNTVCWLAGIRSPREQLERDEINDRNDDGCSPADVIVNITYYENNGGIPGNIYNGATFLVDPTVEVLPGNVCKYSAMHPQVEFAVNTTYWVSIAANISTMMCDYVLYGDNQVVWTLQERNGSTSRSDGSGNLSASYNLGSWNQNTNGFCPSFILSNQGLAPIPTLSQWGLIILGIGIIIFGVSYVRNNQRRIA